MRLWTAAHQDGSDNRVNADAIGDAAEGRIEEDDLDTLMDTLKRMEEYDQAGKLLVPGKAALTAVAGSIAKYTAALTGDPAQAPGANLFGFIREQLLTRQKKVRG